MTVRIYKTDKGAHVITNEAGVALSPFTGEPQGEEVYDANDQEMKTPSTRLYQPGDKFKMNSNEWRRREAAGEAHTKGFIDIAVPMFQMTVASVVVLSDGEFGVISERYSRARDAIDAQREQIKQSYVARLVWLRERYQALEGEQRAVLSALKPASLDDCL